MDREPKQPPFKVGTKLRYIGHDESFTYDTRDGWENKKVVPLRQHGMVVTIDEVKLGRRGTLRHLRDENGPMFYDDTGEPILDSTMDGYSIYHVEAYQSGRKQGRCIDPDSAHEWEVVK